MKKLLLLTLLTAMVFADIKIMTSNKSPIKSVSLEDLAKIYLKKKDTINGIKVIPIDNKDSYNEFCKRVLKKTPKQLRAYWIKEIYRGDKQPPQKLSSSQIKQKMQKNPKIISYASNKLTGKVIFIIK
ncbi:MAG TPA: hypothetical protein ENK99_02590 [Campylobacterales bacterium]|nr:hypothetical protein [Campylobacterales bacterium]